MVAKMRGKKRIVICKEMEQILDCQYWIAIRYSLTFMRLNFEPFKCPTLRVELIEFSAC